MATYIVQFFELMTHLCVSPLFAKSYYFEDDTAAAAAVTHQQQHQQQQQAAPVEASNHKSSRRSSRSSRTAESRREATPADFKVRICVGHPKYVRTDCIGSMRQRGFRCRVRDSTRFKQRAALGQRVYVSVIAPEIMPAWRCERATIGGLPVDTTLPMAADKLGRFCVWRSLTWQDSRGPLKFNIAMRSAGAVSQLELTQTSDNSSVVVCQQRYATHGACLWRVHDPLFPPWWPE